MNRAAYCQTIANFLECSENEILGALARGSEFDVIDKQRNAWLFQIQHLKKVLPSISHNSNDAVYFEYSIPRMGKRIDVLLALKGILFVLEYKVGDSHFSNHAYDQVMDYALDLKNFHETSHTAVISPILIATKAKQPSLLIQESKNDRVLTPISSNDDNLAQCITAVLSRYPKEKLDILQWQSGRYQPTPTIVEAARALYNGHNVKELSRSDAGAINLAQTSEKLEEIITHCREQSKKAICFVTGVPGAGKTLVGLNIATKHFDPIKEQYSVFLSGNGPLVSVLHEALARDRVEQGKLENKKITKGEARSQVKAFIQNVHHFRDEGIKDPAAPIDHIALFDEAQRAWNHKQTSDFMKAKKGLANFNQSESEFLISCMDRHQDWAVIVCLVGGGQEINTGEAGISGWLEALQHKFPDWQIFAAPNLVEKEYQAHDLLEKMRAANRVFYQKELHLSVSMRSFRAERVSSWIKALLDGEVSTAKQLYQEFSDNYPVVLTRSFEKAKDWTREQARGSERYGLLVSSQASRLKPYAIDIRPQIDPVHWFLNGKDDVRSSYYLEDVATEFHVQGLELDWTCVAWDADFRRCKNAWQHFSFKGNKWQNIRKEERQKYQLNAYRVLLTRARQGMAIVIPEGCQQDPTRVPAYYDETFEYLRASGIVTI